MFERNFLLNQIARVVKTKTLRQSSVTFTGTFATGILGMVFHILIARQLGPASLGVFTLCISTYLLIANIGEVGTNTGIVRFAGKYIAEKPKKAYRFLKLALEIKLIVWLVLSVIGWFLVPFIVDTLLEKPELLNPMRITIISVGGGLLFSFSTHSLQALEKFFTWSIINISSNTFRLVVLFLLITFGTLNLYSGLILYYIFPFLGFFIGLVFLPRFLSVKNEWSVSGEFFKYNKWVALFTVIAAMSARLDIFISGRFLPLDQVGIYSVATSLVSIVPQVVFALAVVVAPKLAKFTNNNQATNYLMKLQIFVILLAVLGILVGIPISYFVIPFLYGSEYLASIGPFIVLLFAQAIFLISIPAHTSIFYYFSYPKLFVYVETIHIFLVAILGWTLVSSFGIMGAAFTVLIGNIFNLAMPAAWVFNKFRS